MNSFRRDKNTLSYPWLFEDIILFDFEDFNGANLFMVFDKIFSNSVYSCVLMRFRKFQFIWLRVFRMFVNLLLLIIPWYVYFSIFTMIFFVESIIMHGKWSDMSVVIIPLMYDLDSFWLRYILSIKVAVLCVTLVGRNIVGIIPRFILVSRRWEKLACRFIFKK